MNVCEWVFYRAHYTAADVSPPVQSHHRITCLMSPHQSGITAVDVIKDRTDLVRCKSVCVSMCVKLCWLYRRIKLVKNAVLILKILTLQMHKSLLSPIYLWSKAPSHWSHRRVAEGAFLNTLKVCVSDRTAWWWANIGKRVMNISDIQGKDIWSGKSMIFYSATNEGQMEWDLLQSHLIFSEQMHQTDFSTVVENISWLK